MSTPDLRRVAASRSRQVADPRVARGPQLRNPALTRSLDDYAALSHSGDVLADSKLRLEREHAAAAQRLEETSRSLAASAVAASEKRAAGIEQLLAEARDRGQAASELAAAEASRASKEEAERQQLQRTLDVTLQRLTTISQRERDMGWRLKEAEVQAAYVEPLKRQLHEARSKHAAEVGELRARMRALELDRARSLSAAVDATGAAQHEAGHAHAAVHRATERGHSAAEQVKASRTLLEQVLSRLATMRSLHEVDGVARTLHDAKARLLAAEQDFRVALRHEEPLHQPLSRLGGDSLSQLSQLSQLNDSQPLGYLPDPPRQLSDSQPLGYLPDAQLYSGARTARPERGYRR